MTTHAELVKRLRDRHSIQKQYGMLDAFENPIYAQAADAIEALERERKEKV